LRSRSLWLTRCSVAIRSYPLPRADKGCGKDLPPADLNPLGSDLVSPPEKIDGGNAAILCSGYA